MLQFMLNMIRECFHPYGGELARRIGRLRQPALLDLGILNFSLMREGWRSWSYRAVIRVYDDAGNVIEMHEQAGDFQGVVIARRDKDPPHGEV